MRKTDGFSLLEVMVTVVIIAGALAILLGILRLQIRSMRDLRIHTEARTLLQEKADQFQYGSGAESEDEIQGKYSLYLVTFTAIADSGSSETDAVALGSLSDSRLKHRRIQIRWSDREGEKNLWLDAWRFLPEEFGS